jgi:hypothetical protein
MKQLIFIISIISIAFFYSCQKTVEIEFDGFKNVIVVNSQFAKDSIWRVNVSSSRLTTEKVDLSNLKEAKVSLYEDGELVENLSYQPSSFIPYPGGNNKERRGYFVSNHKAKVDKAYRLEVEAAGYEPVQTEDYIPENSAIIEKFEYLGDSGDGPSLFRLRIKDMPAEANAYHILLKSQVSRLEVIDGDTVAIVDPERYRHYSISGKEQDNRLVQTEEDLIQIAHGFNSPGFILSDENFNQSSKEIIIEAYGISRFFETEPDLPYFNFIRVELRSVSNNYFKYQKSLSLQSANENDPFSEPVFIFNNIENGLGNFAGFNSLYSEAINVWK